MGWLIRNRSAEPAIFHGPTEDIEIAPDEIADVNPRLAREATHDHPDIWERVGPGDPDYIAVEDR